MRVSHIIKSALVCVSTRLKSGLTSNLVTMNADGKKVVVCDNGTGFVKCGYAGSNFPDHVFPCMVGRPIIRSASRLSEEQLRDIEVGERCSQNRSNLEVSYPMKNGKVVSWEDMRHVWDHTFGEEKMNLDPKETLIMLTEPPMNPLKNRQKMMKMRCSRTTASTGLISPPRPC